jgi:hypothetical protein
MPTDAQEKPACFTGMVTNTSLPDIIQLLCIGRNSCRMHVCSGFRKGFIDFRDGEVIHAETKNARSERAFYEVFSWELGTFECEQVPLEKETINESWEFLLMESVRRLEAAEHQ